MCAGVCFVCVGEYVCARMYTEKKKRKGPVYTARRNGTGYRFKIFRKSFGTGANYINELKIKVFWTIDEPVTQINDLDLRTFLNLSRLVTFQQYSA